MTITSLDDILLRVGRPSRYLGSEINSVRKNPETVKLGMALAFPDLYEIGTSHFGLQILYHILNSQPDVAAERVFAPGTDMADQMKAVGIPLFSLETRTPLSDFDIVGFSLLYELNYTNVLMMLDLAGIPFYAAERNSNHPLVIAGGPCTVNPEPVADFFDALVVGDGETVIVEMTRAALAWKEGGSGNREELLRAWADIEGVYVPAFFTAEYDNAGRQRLVPKVSGYNRVTRAIVGDLDQAPFPDQPIIPFGRPVHDRLRLEIARGCTRGCRFCQAGMIYRPVRERSLALLENLAARSLAATGYEELSLLSLSTGDYSCLSPLMSRLMQRYADRQLAVSIPSFRAGTLTPELMELIRQVRKTGFTIAPEAGSDRLRAVINKNIGEEEIVETVSAAFSLGWQLIKLYFMVGLPTETDADLEAIAGLVSRLKKIRHGGARRANINVSAATFIPKAHTPFQWVPQIDLATAREKIEQLRHLVKMPGVQFKWQKPETSVLEGLFARGDRRLSPLLVAAYEAGCRFDGWTDEFDYRTWAEVMGRMGIDPEEQAMRTTDPEAPLPWDHIDSRVSKAFLRDEYERAVQGAATPDCRTEECQGCGVCDFQAIEPKIAAGDTPQDLMYKEESGSRRPEGSPEKLKLTFSRRDSSRHFGHLELINIITRAIVRAGIPVAFSGGFHPKPKIAFDDALPVGVESLEEIFYLTVNAPVPVEKVRKGLNRQLPDGLEILDCRVACAHGGPARPKTAAYRVCLPSGRFEPSRLEAYLQAESVPIRQLTKKGAEKTVDLKGLVEEITPLGPACLWLRLANQPGQSIRPAAVIREIFSLTEQQVLKARIIKLPEAATPETADRWIA